jgi:hypothetical protein
VNDWKLKPDIVPPGVCVVDWVTDWLLDCVNADASCGVAADIPTAVVAIDSTMNIMIVADEFIVFIVI